MKKSNHDDSLGTAYETMYKRAAEKLHSAQEKSDVMLHKFIDEAKEKAVELEELTKEDAQKISEWLKRDLNDKIHYLAETEYELKDWLGFEINFIETVLLDWLLQTADKTTVELLALKENARKASIYSTGEITGPGTLICDECDEVLHFHKAGKIPPCPKCHTTHFHRRSK